MMHLQRLQILQSRKYTLIIGGILGALVIGGYIIWSQYTWAQLTPASEQWHQGVHNTLDKAIVLPTTNISEQDIVVTKLTELSNIIETEHQTVCGISPLVQWQQKIAPALNDMRLACEKKVAAVIEFQKRLTIVITYNKDDHALTGIITSVPQLGEVTDDTLAGQVTAWDDVVKATEKLTVTDNFKPVRQLALIQMTAAKTAWQEVITAHQAKDKQKYLAAQSALASAIDGFSEVSVTSQQTFEKLSRELDKASNAAFIDQ